MMPAPATRSFLPSVPFVIGATTASLTLTLPKSLMSHYDLPLPGPLFSKLDGFSFELPVGTATIGLLVGGFIAGYCFAKSLSFFRHIAIRRLLQDQDWMYSQTWKTKIWAALLKLSMGQGQHKTYEFQECLPHQPLPNLDDTLDRYLEVSRVYQTEEEFQQTRLAVEEFRVNEGPVLQEHLFKRKQQTPNWVSDYWSYAAYLSNRESLMYNSSYTIANCLNSSLKTDQLTRAASFIYYSSKYKQSLKRNDIQPVMVQDIVPLCMEGYKYLFNTNRLPGEYVDSVATYPECDYVIVIRNGHYYQLNLEAVVDGVPGEPTLEEIKQQLIDICKHADESPAELPVAVLTVQNRTTWFKHRQILSLQNEETLRIIERSMFIVALDNGPPPQTVNEYSTLIATGRGNDRWYDKSFTYVIFSNVFMGCYVEHTSMDGTAYGNYFEEVITMEVSEIENAAKRAGQKLIRTLPTPARLTWNFEGLEDLIATAQETYKQYVDDIDIYQQAVEYGKGFMKTCRTSPDGYIQMALQLGYYRLYKETPKTYESATSRLFLLGRTETIHPVSEWSKQWVLSMDDTSVSSAKKVELLKKAVKYQTQYRLDATAGRACDRHLLGLLCVSAELGMTRPKIFTDAAWMKPFKMSTSQTPTRFHELVGYKIEYEKSIGTFGPVTLDGYGVSYFVTGDEILVFAVSSRKSSKETDSRKLATCIQGAFKDMKAIFDESK